LRYVQYYSVKKILNHISLWSKKQKIQKNKKIQKKNIPNPNLNIPPKESFIPIESGVNTLIELTSAYSELYYSFDNHFEYSDIAITVKNAHQYTTIMYFYENYEISKKLEGVYVKKQLGVECKIRIISVHQKRLFPDRHHFYRLH